MIVLLVSTPVTSAQAHNITITFEGNGSYFDEDRQITQLQAVFSDNLDALTFPTIYTDFIAFEGWFLDQAGQEPFIGLPEGTTEVTLYPVFSDQAVAKPMTEAGAALASETIRILFDGNGAYLDERGQTLSLYIDYPDRAIDASHFPQAYLEEKLFQGWFLDPAGEIPFDTLPEDVSELTLYAKFRVTEYRELPPYNPIDLSSTDSHDFQYDLLMGRNRYATAVEVSRYMYPKSDMVVLATGYDFADSLAAGPLASALGAPLLLTSTNTLSTEAREEILRLGAFEVWLIGSYGAISQAVEDELVSMGLEVYRLGGDNRFETSRLVNQALFDITPGTNRAFMAIYDNYPDALSIAGYAAQAGAPILYSRAHELHEQTVAFIEENNITSIVIIGNLIQPSVKQELINRGVSVSQLGGKNRYETNQAVIGAYYPSNQGVALTKGFDFPDSLVAAPLAANNGTGLLLIQSTGFNESQKEYIKTYPGSNNYQVGGIEGFDPAKELQRKPIRILLDPGHGRYDNASPVVSGYYEGTQVWYLANELRSYLHTNYNFVEVGTTRPSISDNPDLPIRGMMGEGFDLFFSLHTNALPGYPGKRGSLIFDMAIQPYLSENPDPAKPNPELAKRLVAASAGLVGHPNEGVKYAYWNMVRGDVPGNQAFWSDSPAGYPGFWNEYGVMRNSRAKNAMLIEMGYHTNYTDAVFFMNNIKAMARTLGDTLATYFDLPRK